MKNIINADCLIKEALKEDAADNDVTTNFFIGNNRKAKAVLIAKADGVLCGVEIFKRVFKIADKNCKVISNFSDGDVLKKGDKILEVSGGAKPILSAERTALNFIQHLSGIATTTNRFVKALKSSKAKIFDTRKTIPAFRQLAKYAVRCGGASNHRMGLSSMVIIKDNHLRLIKDLSKEIELFRKAYKNIPVEVECQNFSQVKKALNARADLIMLDNMKFKDMKEAIKYIRAYSKNSYKPEIEISGGVNEKTAKKFASLDIERISAGMLTHSSKALDMSLEITII
ncbi:MAG: carboxylating nicotinate-nucleotide diphosphorylase [Elusimicrobiota bacterium]|jgi:nicotinate-nucleotide pyrophosphorylase (carboxylating)|nr:carboxylating nicotinate-nucleotide diphosphorylase [Elusimicrobiota bacterium]